MVLISIILISVPMLRIPKLWNLNVGSGECADTARLIWGQLDLTHTEYLPHAVPTFHLGGTEAQPRIVEVALSTPTTLLDLRIGRHLLGLAIVYNVPHLRISHHFVLKQVDRRYLG